MLYADALRGFDSTGIIAVDKDGSFSILKEASQASEFIPKLKTNQIFKGMWNNGKVWIGHNRKKTVGEIKDETAHPFVVDKTFAMVHNGTLHTYKHLDDKALTDSQALAGVLKKGLDAEDHIQGLNEGLGKVWGAYALAFFHQEKNKVYLLRNKERPLSIVETDDAYFFASEPLMALWILARQGYDHTKLKWKSLTEHVLYSYDLEKNTWTEETLDPKKATATTSVANNTTTHGKNAPSTVEGIEVNKSTFKHIKRKLLGSKTYFWVQDHVESEYPKTIQQGATQVMVFGQDDLIKWKHDISAVVDMVEHSMLTEEDIYDVKWCGTIESVSWSETAQSVVITVEKLQPMPKANPGALKKLWIKGLEMKSLVVLKKEKDDYQFKYTDWQLEALDDAIAKREQEVKNLQDSLDKSFHKEGLKAALAEALQKGMHVVSEKRGDKQVWFDDNTDEVVYESPVTLH